MANWLPFDGTAKDNGDSVHLTPKKGDGVVELKKDDVKIDGDEIHVRDGSIAKTIKESTGKPPADFKIPAEARANCPGGKTKCIGLVLFCCSNGKVIGPCIGAWGC
jgi:hypothetical protein